AVASAVYVIASLEAHVFAGGQCSVYRRPRCDRVRRKCGLQATPRPTFHQASKRRQIITPFLKEIRVECVDADNTESRRVNHGAEAQSRCRVKRTTSGTRSAGV